MGYSLNETRGERYIHIYILGGKKTAHWDGTFEYLQHMF